MIATGAFKQAGLDKRLYYLTDANMNVTALVNTSGQVVERYEYDPCGRHNAQLEEQNRY